MWHRYEDGEQWRLVYKPAPFYHAILTDWADALEESLGAEGGNHAEVHPLIVLFDKVTENPKILDSAVLGMCLTRTDPSGICEIYDIANEAGNGRNMLGLITRIEGPAMMSRWSVSRRAASWWRKMVETCDSEELPQKVYHWKDPQYAYLNHYIKSAPSPWTSSNLKLSHDDVATRLAKIMNSVLEELQFPKDRRLSTDDLEEQWFGTFVGYFKKKYDESIGTDGPPVAERDESGKELQNYPAKSSQV